MRRLSIITRRSFLKTAGAALAGMVLPPRSQPRRDEAWPQGANVRLGRVTVDGRIRISSRPNPDGDSVGYLYTDDVVPILRDVVGQGALPHNHVWFELENGYAYSRYLQPVKNLPNTPLPAVPPEGVWTEVSVPYVDAHALPKTWADVRYRLYYSAVFKITEAMRADDGAVWYRVFDENGNRLFAPAAAFRPIGSEEVAPISPEVEDKLVVVYMKDQALSAFEGQREVFRAIISSGADYFGEDGQTLQNGTPAGAHPIWSKRFSRHMSGGTREAGYDLPGVAWVSYFAGNGAAIHSTYWHNDFGIPKSHGCLNCRPDDAQWLFRWTVPPVPYQPGDITVDWRAPSTYVDIRAEA